MSVRTWRINRLRQGAGDKHGVTRQGDRDDVPRLLGGRQFFRQLLVVFHAAALPARGDGAIGPVGTEDELAHLRQFCGRQDVLNTQQHGSLLF